VFNTHLSLPTFWAREYWARDEKMGFGQNQLEEARAVAGYVDATARGEPFVLVGDFNAPPATPVYRYLTERASCTCACTSTTSSAATASSSSS
jgi:endonuclease/exonuclease/phosphatase family metal-dependent hydrolase